MITTDDLTKEEETPKPKKAEKAPAPVAAPVVDDAPVTRAEFEALKNLFRKVEGDVSYIRRRVG